jgi:hypothetical protein
MILVRVRIGIEENKRRRKELVQSADLENWFVFLVAFGMTGKQGADDLLMF